MENRTTQSFPRRERGLDSFKRTMRRSARRARGGGALSAVLRGVLVAAAVTVLGVVLFALLLNWWDASDRAITAINQVVKFVSILAGVVSALNGQTQGGTARGVCVGFLYMALGILCYCLLMGENPSLTSYLADLGMGVAGGGIVGMIVSNLPSR